METEDLLPYSQKQTIGSYPEPQKFSPHYTIPLL
jgi:hypothetical protein